jgi:hypothetical protein
MAAKVFASEMIWRAADEMVQVAGGRGFVQPYPYERMLRDARINRIFEGANEVLRLFIGLNGVQGPAEELKEIGTALRRPIQNWAAVAGFATSRVRMALGATDKIDVPVHARLEAHKGYVEKHVGQLKAATLRAVLKHRKRIIERQLVVERLADMAIELYARGTTIARTQRLIDERGVERCEREIALCDLFCVESGLRFRRARGAGRQRRERGRHASRHRGHRARARRLPGERRHARRAHRAGGRRAGRARHRADARRRRGKELAPVSCNGVLTRRRGRRGAEHRRPHRECQRRIRSCRRTATRRSLTMLGITARGYSTMLCVLRGSA